MQRTLQLLLIVSFIAFSWLAFMVVHELGHAVSAWLSGGSVSLVVLHPFQISWTTFSRNPRPQLVAWGGPFWGAFLPVLFLGTARLIRSPRIYLFRFFAGFCLIANGLYMLVDSFGRGVMAARSFTPVLHSGSCCYLVRLQFHLAFGCGTALVRILALARHMVTLAEVQSPPPCVCLRLRLPRS